MRQRLFCAGADDWFFPLFIKANSNNPPIKTGREVFMKPRHIFSVVVVLSLFLTPCAFSAQLNFRPEFTVTEEYNDNIFLTPDNEEDDFITRATLGGTLELLGRTAGLELTYLPSYEWYDDFSDFDGWTHDAFSRAWYNFTANTTLELRDAFIRTRGSLTDTDFLGVTTDDPLVAPDIESDRLRRGRSEYYTNSTTLRLDHRFGAEDTVYAAFDYRLRRDVDAGLDENDIWEPSIGGTYWFTNFWGVETDMLYSNREYESETDRSEWYGRFRLNRRINRHLSAYTQYQHRIVDYDSNTSGDIDFDVYEPTVGASYQLDQNTRIDIGVGWYFQNLDRGDDEDGFIMDAEADKVWPFRRGLIGVTLLSGSDVDDEGVEDLGFHVYYEGTVRGEYNFTPRFIGTASTGYRWDDYPDSDPSRTDKTLFAAAGLEYQALRWMVVSVNYFFRDLSSDAATAEYTENRVLLGITLTPEQPFRLLR
jgi:hypothetical protein